MALFDKNESLGAKIAGDKSDNKLIDIDDLDSENESIKDQISAAADKKDFMQRIERGEAVPKGKVKSKKPTAQKKKPNAAVPDWTKMGDKEIFFDERNNEYSVVIFANDESNDEILSTAMVQLGDMDGLSSKMEESDIEQYVSDKDIQVKDTYVPTKSNQSRKILCSIPLKKYQRIKKQIDKKTTTSQQPAEDNGYFVEISRQDYDKYFNGLGNILTKVGKDYEFAHRTGKYNVPNLRFLNEIKKLKIFKKQLSDFLDNNDISMKDKSLDKIGLLYKSDPKETYHNLNSVWFKDKTQSWEKAEKGFKSFSTKSPANDKTTLAFVKSLPDIYRKYSSDSPPPFNQFIEDYVYPPRSPKDTSSPSLGSDNNSSYNQVVPGNEVKGYLTSFGESFNESIPSEFDTGYTWDQKKKLDNILKDPSVLRRRTQDSLNRVVKSVDPIIDTIQDAVEMAENLDDLYSDVLNPLGISGISALLSEGILKKIKSLPLDKVMKQTVSSILAVIPDEQLYEIYSNTIGGDLLGGIEREIEGIFVDIAWPEINPNIPIPNIDDLQISSIVRPGLFNPLQLPKDICLGIPGIQKNQNFERIKKTFLHMVDKDLIRPEKFVDLLEKTGAVTDKDVVKKIFRFNIDLNPDISFSRSSRGSSGPSSPRSGRAASRNSSRSSGGRGAGGRGAGGRNAERDRKNSSSSSSSRRKMNSLDVKSHYSKNRTRNKSKLNDITLPYIPQIPIPSFGDFGKIAINLAEKKLEKISMKIIKILLKKVLSAIFSDSDKVKPDKIAGAPRDKVKNILKKNLTRPGSSNKEVNKSINKLLNSFSIWDPARKKPTDKDVGDFIDSISISLSNQQIIDLFSGASDNETLSQVRQAIDNLPNKNISDSLPSDSDIDNMFSSLGNLIDRNALQAQEDIETVLGAPRITVDLCSLPPQIEMANRLSSAALANKGLTPEEIADQLKKAEDLALDDLGDLIKALASPEDLIANLGDIPIKQTPEGPVVSPMSTDPRNQEDGLYPTEDESTARVISDTYETLYKSMNTIAISDMTIGNPNNITSRGFLDMVLASEKGRPFSKISDDILGAGSGLSFGRGPNIPKDISDLKDTLVSGTFDVFRASPYKVESRYTKDNYELALQYEIGENLFFNGSEYRDEKELVVRYEKDDNVDDFIDSFSSKSKSPSDIFGDWVLEIWSDHIGESLDSEVRANVLTALKSYAEDTLYKSVIQSMIRKITKEIRDNDRAWSPASGKIEDSVGTPKMVFLDEDTYGEESFYIDYEPGTGFSNWVEIYMETAQSELLGDKPPLIDFADLAPKTQEYYDNMPDDPRISLPNLPKIKESPFCRINTRLNNAGLAGLMRSIIRVHLYEALLKGTAAFQIYAMDNDNYRDVYVSYIVDKVLEGVLNESRKTMKFIPGTLGKKGYYYIFLEQVVQSYSNLTNLGLEDLDITTEKSLESIKESLKFWDPSGNKDKKFKEFLDNSLPNIKDIISKIVKEEMGTVLSKTKNIYKPSVENIVSDMLEKEEWMFGSIESGLPIYVPSDLEDDYLGDLDFVFETDEKKNEKKSKYFYPFVLEKYIKLTDKETGLSTIASPSNINPLEIDKFDTAMGTRMSMVMPIDFSEIFNWSDIAPLNEALALKFNKVKSFIVSGKKQTYYVFPLVFEERPAVFDDFSNQDLYKEMARSMLDNDQFKTLFEKCFPIADILTYLTIYVIENFVESLTDRDNLLPSAFTLWNGEILEMSKKYLKSTTQQFYYGRSSEFIDQISSEIKPSKKIGSGISEGIMKASVNTLKLTRKQKRNLRQKPDDVE